MLYKSFHYYYYYLDFDSDYATVLNRAGLQTLELAGKRTILVEMYKVLKHLSPPFMWSVFIPKLACYHLRNSQQLCIPHLNPTKYGLRSCSEYGATLWNSLPDTVKSCRDLDSFKACMDNWQEPHCKFMRYFQSACSLMQYSLTDCIYL